MMNCTEYSLLIILVFSGYYYCYHHPDGVIPEYSIDCECRKPKNYFVLKAISEFDIDIEKFMVYW